MIYIENQMADSTGMTTSYIINPSSRESRHGPQANWQNQVLMLFQKAERMVECSTRLGEQQKGLFLIPPAGILFPRSAADPFCWNEWGGLVLMEWDGSSFPWIGKFWIRLIRDGQETGPGSLYKFLTI